MKRRLRSCFPRWLSAAALASFLLVGLQPAQAQQAEPNTGPDVQGSDLTSIQPGGANPDWAPHIDPQMLAVVEQFLASEPPTPITQLSAFQFRNAVLPAEAALALMMKAGIPAQAPQTDIAHRILPVGPAEGLLVRTYTPLDAGDGPLPVIVYYHGGGWVIADLDTYEPSAKALAAKTGAIVVSVAYRQAPEYRYPTAHEDAFAAYQWVTQNADSLGGDPARIATAGESAGGNLAVAVALMAQERDAPLPVHIAAVYPVADGDVQSASYDEYANAIPLNRPLMEWFFDYYAPRWQTNERRLINLVDAEYRSDFPATTIVNAQIDPLQAEGEELAQRLSDAGVDVEQRTFAGVTHEFFGMAALLEQAAEAQDMVAQRLQNAFSADGSVSTSASPGNAMADSSAASDSMDTSADSARTTSSGMASDSSSAGMASGSGMADSSAAGGSAVTIRTMESGALGPYLTDADGRAVYLFRADDASASACYDACAEAWPPVLTDGMPTASGDAQEGLIGTLEREDGQTQVTYASHPLYYFTRDSGPGQRNGQDVMGFGAEWYLLTPAGQAVEEEDEPTMNEEDGGMDADSTEDGGM